MDWKWTEEKDQPWPQTLTCMSSDRWGPMTVVVLDIGTQGRLKITSSENEDAVEHSRRSVPPKRSANAFASGLDRGGDDP